jgi:hypothetical protein
MSKDQWIAEHVRIGDEYGCDKIERTEAERQLRVLGFDPGEIADQLDAIDRDKA